MVLETKPNKKGDEPIQVESDDESDDEGISQGQNEMTETRTPILLPSTSKTAVRRGKIGSVKNVASAEPDPRPRRERKEPDRLKY